MRHDVMVIGSGQAGVPLAARLAGAGRRVLMVERGQLGGTCVNTGCTPTKTMIASARAAHVARTAGRLGVDTGSVEVDLAAVVDRKASIVDQWRSGVRSRLDGADGLTLVRGHARFTGPRRIAVEGKTHEADVVIVNVGGRPVQPAIPGLDGVPWLDNARLMELREVPEHLVVLGGGYIGCELGQAYRRFGARVTLLDRNERLLSREDEDVSMALMEAFEAEGIGFRPGVTVTAVDGGEERIVVHTDGGDVEGSHLLVAAGRRPNTDDLGCETAGIELDGRGYIQVDDHYRTSAGGVYAVGDVTGGAQFTHASWDDHRILYDILVHGADRRTRADRLIPHVVYTDPQVAGVGLSERTAREQGVAFEVASMPFGNVSRAIETDETAGILKVLVDPKSERILGATFVGVEAGELIHIIAAVMQARASARALVDMEHAHPAFSEGIQSVLMRLERFALG